MNFEPGAQEMQGFVLHLHRVERTTGLQFGGVRVAAVNHQSSVVGRCEFVDREMATDRSFKGSPDVL